MGKNLATSQRLATSIPFFAMIVAPLGVAGQNIGLGLAMLMFIIWSVHDKAASLRRTLTDARVRPYILTWMMIILPVTLATLARGEPKEASRFFWGYIYACSMVIGGLTLRSAPIHRILLLNTATVLSGIMGLVALSQFILGWKIESGHIVDQIKRAQGFYSHPLTFAYVTLIIMPWCVARPMGRPRQWQSWVLGASALMIIAASQSVTVLALTALSFVMLAVRLLPRKTMLITFAAATLAGATILATPNSISHKLTQVLTGQRGDHETDYPDDRMAFWHANWEMFKDAPVTGHGTGLESTDRQPYYEKIGLGHLKRMYESHNMFLQYAVEGGFVTPLAFLCFLIWWSLRLRGSLATERWHKIALTLTPVIFALGGLTQNAVQDSEVRYMMLLVCACGLWLTRDRAETLNA